MITIEICEKAMELTPEQDRNIKAIMAEMDCPAGFPCYESGFEALTAVRILSYGPVECLRAKEELCPMSVSFGLQDRRCECPLRRYLASEFGR